VILRFGLWWLKIKQHLIIATAITVVFFALIILTFAVYKFGWDWTGFNGGYGQVTTHTSTKDTVLPPAKTLWDWLNLLGLFTIPVVVGLGTIWFTTQQGKVSDAKNKDNQRETALQAYIDNMSELLLEKGLRKSNLEDEVRTIARVRTLTVLNLLDGKRKRSLLQFLVEARLITKDSVIIDLEGANLRGADLASTNLRETNLSGAILNRANLSYADLTGADLTHARLMEAFLYSTNLKGAKLLVASLLEAHLNGANLEGADLAGTILIKANMDRANLKGTNITAGQLNTIESLEGAIMRDGSKHP
jgi:uncharacterized protein YjbI with pentapeptide repeats